MSEATRLRVYRFDPGAVFEGGLIGAIERMQLGDGAKLLDALFVRRDAATGALRALETDLAMLLAEEDVVSPQAGMRR